jgi:hypothetical protein
MNTRGVFGYIIRNKKYLVYVHYDADTLFDILIRELYILIKKYGSIEVLQIEFEKIKIVEDDRYPTPEDIEKCKYFTDLDVGYGHTNDWYCLLRGCQKSFINTLEAGYIQNYKEYDGFVVILDFDKKVLVSCGNFEYKSITIEEIMRMEDMPTQTYDEIITELKERHEAYTCRLVEIYDEIFNNIKDLILNINDDENLLKKIKNLLSDAQFKKSILKKEKRDFYERLKALNMIKEEDE